MPKKKKEKGKGKGKGKKSGGGAGGSSDPFSADFTPDASMFDFSVPDMGSGVDPAEAMRIAMGSIEESGKISGGEFASEMLDDEDLTEGDLKDPSLLSELRSFEVGDELEEEDDDDDLPIGEQIKKLKEKSGAAKKLAIKFKRQGDKQKAIEELKKSKVLEQQVKDLQDFEKEMNTEIPLDDDDEGEDEAPDMAPIPSLDATSPKQGKKKVDKKKGKAQQPQEEDDVEEVEGDEEADQALKMALAAAMEAMGDVQQQVESEAAEGGEDGAEENEENEMASKKEKKNRKEQEKREKEERKEAERKEKEEKKKQKKRKLVNPEKAKEILEPLYNSYRKAAVNHNRNGDKVEAKEALATSKLIKELMEKAEAGDSEIYQDEIPTEPVVPEVKVDPKRVAELGKIEKSLKKQLALVIDNIKRVTAEGKKDEIQEFMADKTRLGKDMELIKKCKANPLVPLPKVQTEKRHYRFIHKNRDLRDGDLEVRIIKAENLQISGSTSTDIDSYVEAILPYPSTKPQKLEGSSVKGTADPEYDCPLVFQIERKRSLERVFQKKKLLLEIFEPRFLRSPVSIGKCAVPLTDLLLKTDFVGQYECFGSNRRQCTGILHVKVSLSRPLQKDEMREINVDYMLLSAAEDPKKRAPAKKAQPKSESPSNVKVESEVPAKGGAEVPKEKADAAPIAKAAPAKADTSVVVEGRLPDGEDEFKFVLYDPEDPNPIENIVANGVIEWEQENIEKKIQATGSIEQIERKGMLDIKLQLLMVAIQTGQLDIETYTGSLETKITAEKKFALEMKRRGEKSHALMALKRAKLMQQELEEGEEEIDEGDEG